MAAASKAPLSRADVVSEVAAATQMSQGQVDEVIKAFESSLKRALSSGGEVRMVGLGTFKVSSRAARMGRNPKTGEALKIGASKNVRFSAGKAFKDAVGGKSTGASKGASKSGGASKGGSKGAAKSSSASKSSGVHKAAVTLGRAGKGGSSTGGATKGGAAKGAGKASAGKGGRK